MPSRRMIDPEFWQSYSMARLTYRQRLLFIGLFSNADDQGRLRAHPGLVRALVFPMDEISNDEVATDLEAIAKVGSIVIYQAEDSESAYIQIVGWWQYQSPQWAYPSTIPPPQGWADRLRYRQDGSVQTQNWEAAGGFGNALPGALGKALPSALAKALPGGKVNVKVRPQYSIGQYRASIEQHSDPTTAERNACALYHQYVGLMNGGIAAELVDLIAETEEFRTNLPRDAPGADVPGDEWVCEAIREMARAGPDRPNVRYIVSIINRWRVQGYKSERRPHDDTGRPDGGILAGNVTAAQVDAKLARLAGGTGAKPGDADLAV